MASKRFLIVPDDSSAARIPFPGATIACATLFNLSRFIAFSLSSSSLRARSASRGSRNCTWLLASVLSPRQCPECQHTPLFYSQHLDSRQGLAFEPLQERAAGG